MEIVRTNSTNYSTPAITVVAVVSFHATARQRNKPVVIQKEEAHVWTFRYGKFARFENGRYLKDALEASGLSE